MNRKEMRVAKFISFNGLLVFRVKYTVKSVNQYQCTAVYQFTPVYVPVYTTVRVQYTTVHMFTPG